MTPIPFTIEPSEGEDSVEIRYRIWSSTIDGTLYGHHRPLIVEPPEPKLSPAPREPLHTEGPFR